MAVASSLSKVYVRPLCKEKNARRPLFDGLCLGQSADPGVGAVAEGDGVLKPAEHAKSIM